MINFICFAGSQDGLACMAGLVLKGAQELDGKALYNHVRINLALASRPLFLRSVYHLLYISVDIFYS